MKLKLYIGAHKTATTHVQRLLVANRERLVNNNIHLSIPSCIRPLWFPLLNQYPSDKHTESIEKILSNSPSSGTWIFAEENVSGVPYDLKVKAGIYPDITKNLTVFMELFPDAEIEVFFSIRSYDSFYASSYLEVVRNRGFFPFNQYYDEKRFEKNSWYSVIRDITDTIGSQRRLTLWRYEDFKALLPYVLRGLTELDDTKVLEMISNYNSAKTRPSISQKTLELIEKKSPFESKALSKQMLEDLNQKYPASPENGYFMPFSTELTDQFKTQYKNDLELIKQSLPHIKYLNPSV